MPRVDINLVLTVDVTTFFHFCPYMVDVQLTSTVDISSMPIQTILPIGLYLDIWASSDMIQDMTMISCSGYLLNVAS